MSQTLTFREAARHQTKNDLWLIIHNKVYDVTKFMDEHPGGEDVLLDQAGQDASSAFEDVGHSDEASEAGDPEPITPTAPRSKTPEAAVNTSFGIPRVAGYIGGLVCSVIAVGLYLNSAA
ncbi:hypothetical protein DL766_006714 [Monosporascus sp. MC13-8B]|uniref:Cytochrome b5 heme-binding domain-containing protein n=1 Tax=Monosporascus cannonballus TaxID=155416 RepID=A0ABY0HA45_9PEZI|nr:hypothetical protein DL762_003611 [Monosporascus cannonballus]RYO93961.1 hypothetical protein DL763_004235 [Monosporascus cannonballus]RYP26529.1 hypothetical protein DL766_006714 [Monosporascus sp. MC13-8B]